MSLLASRLAAMVFVIVFIFLCTLILLGTTPKQNTADTMKLIKIPGISLSTSYLGDRILEYSDESNKVYIEINQDTYAGFVYAK